MTFIPREELFTCAACGNDVEPLGKGTYRDHCPVCLFSQHVDLDGPGDRLSPCKKLLRPISIDQDGKKGFVIMYKCEGCKKLHRNRAAPDDDIIGFLKNSENSL